MTDGQAQRASPQGPEASGIKAGWPRLGTRRGAQPASPTAERRDARNTVSRSEVENSCQLQSLSVFLIFGICRLGNRYPALAGDACPDAYVLAFGRSPVSAPVQYGTNHRLPRMILIRLGRAADCIPSMLVWHVVQAWANQLVQNFSLDIVPPTMVRHLKIPNAR